MCAQANGSGLVLDSEIWREQIIVIHKKKVMFSGRNAQNFLVDELLISADGTDCGIYMFEGETCTDAECLHNNLVIAAGKRPTFEKEAD